MNSHPWSIELPAPLIAAIVLSLIYFLRVLRQRTTGMAKRLLLESRREVRRALSVADELERVVVATRDKLDEHQANLRKFKNRLGSLNKTQHRAAREELCRHVEEILNPTLRLAGQVAEASSQICQQTAHLMTLSAARIDALTGVNNRAGLDHALSVQLAQMARYGTEFSLTLLDIDSFKQVNDRQGHLEGDRILQEVAKLMDTSIRDVDVLARYGGDEFVVVMPHTNLEDAGQFSERMRAKFQQEMPVTVSGGVASAVSGDTPESLLGRADAAMYVAKHAGRNCLFYHDGETTEAVAEDADLSGGNLEDTTSCAARPSDTAGTVNQATEAVESERPQAVVAEPADLLGQVAE